jgi:hypothetical protein
MLKKKSSQDEDGIYDFYQRNKLTKIMVEYFDHNQYKRKKKYEVACAACA